MVADLVVTPFPSVREPVPAVTPFSEKVTSRSEAPDVPVSSTPRSVTASPAKPVTGSTFSVVPRRALRMAT